MNKLAVITGAAGNLGKATVEKFVAEGYSVAVTVYPGKKLGYYEDHPQVDIYSVDLLDEPAVEGFVHTVKKKYGSIDVALMLAGGYAYGSIADTNESDLRKMYSINFETAYYTSRPVFNEMINQENGGRLVFMGARPALIASEGKNNMAYSLAKSLLFTLADNLNAAGADHNIVSTVVVPSIIDTPPNRDAMPKADFSKWVKPQEIAETILYVVSEKASHLRHPIMKVYGKS